MERWHRDAGRSGRRWREKYLALVDICLNREIGADPFALAMEEIPRQPGRYRKRTALGCGRPRCRVCHGEKFPVRLKTFAEIRADVAFAEMLGERQRADQWEGDCAG